MRLSVLIATALFSTLGNFAAAEPVATSTTIPSSTSRTLPRFSVVVEGAGPDVILIPGLASPRSVWAATAERLKGTHRVHLIQVAGFAGEPARANAGGAIVAPLADALAAYVKAADLKSPAVIGHSMGGEAALMLAARHPASVKRLLVIDALPFFPLTMHPDATVAALRPQAAMMRDRLLAMTSAQARAAQTATMARLVKTKSARPALTQASLASDRSVMARATYELMTTDLRPSLAEIGAPLTVLYAHDPAQGAPPAAIDALYRAAYSGAPRARLERIDGSFHFIMVDQPKRLNAAIDSFLG